MQPVQLYFVWRGREERAVCCGIVSGVGARKVAKERCPSTAHSPCQCHRIDSKLMRRWLLYGAQMTEGYAIARV